MISASGAKVNTTAAHASNNFAIVDGDFEHIVDADTGSFERLSLRNCARKSIKQIAIGTIRRRHALLDQSDDDLVRHQSASVHDFFCSNTQWRAGLDRCTQHVAGGNLRDFEFLGDETGLRTFASAGRSKKNKSHKCSQ